MRKWTHEKLHALMEANSVLKEKSDQIHALKTVSSEEKEQGKLQMMEIYAKVIDCRQLDAAQEYVRRFFKLLRQEMGLDELRNEYASKKLCHSPAGNDYLCFCGNK